MAATSSISFISLIYCVFILSMCQINLSMALSLYQYKSYPFPDQQQHGRPALSNGYLRQNYPVIIISYL
jgi:hypothetical protein